MRLGAAAVTMAFISASSASAFAEECEGDDWFCEESSAETEEGEAAEDTAPEAAPEADEPPKKKGKPPVVVYYPYDGDKPPPKIVVDRDENEPGPPKARHRKRHAINTRLQGVLMGDDEDDEFDRDAGMGGIGASYRYRPVRSLALDVGIDFFAGQDFQGFQRTERALSLNGLVFFNPRDKVQVYALFGLGFSSADVEREGPTGEIIEDDYGYFGFQTGLGLEFAVWRSASLNLDLIGFIRGRTDAEAAENPEFVDPETGRATNTSGGGLLRGGVTFYF